MTDEERANQNVASARGILEGFEHCSLEAKHGAIKHAIAELQNAQRALPDERTASEGKSEQ